MDLKALIEFLEKAVKDGRLKHDIGFIKQGLESGNLPPEVIKDIDALFIQKKRKTNGQPRGRRKRT